MMTDEQFAQLKIARELAVWRVLEETQGDFQAAREAAKVQQWLQEIFPQGIK